MKKLYLSLLALGLCLFGNSAFAVFPPASLTTLDVTSFESMAALVVVAIAAMWGIKKAIHMIRG